MNKMKNYYYALIIMCFVSFDCNAKYSLDAIDMEYLIENGDENKIKEPEAIDMGGSVLWASFNLYAERPTEVGIYCGWGDPTGNLKFQADIPDEENYIEPEVCTAMYGGIDPPAYIAVPI